MGIIYRKGDVLKAFEAGEVDVVIHQTNCQGVMGAGIARQIREYFPEAYEAYKDAERHMGLRLGETSHACFDRDINGWIKWGTIINLNGQDQYIDRLKCNTNYAALGTGLMSCLDLIEDSDVIAMPKIGAGLGGGDWNVIEAIINSVFTDRDVYVYTLD
jgi:O-acetyl-ADP-ribose deacetylase (regulator of RNase III)